MANRELYDDTKGAISINVAAHTTDVTGTAVDLRGYRSALILIQTGVITDGSHNVSVMVADDDGTGSPGSFSAVTESDTTLIKGTVPTITASNDNALYEFAYMGSHDYIRIDAAISGATTGGIYGAVVLRGHPRHASTRSAQV